MEPPRHSTAYADHTDAHGIASQISVALLTGGGDKPYAFGLATALITNEARLDLIGNDELSSLRSKHGITFLNLRGNQRSDAGFVSKILRILSYYARLIRYAATAKPRIFHILWNNKFEAFDRTLLMLYYRLLGKKIVLTLHNINAGERDGSDTPFNRLTLRIQYRLADHIFVHTEKMKLELMREFRVSGPRITVIPFGINNSVPNTDLTYAEARLQLGIREGQRTILFFGNIAPYKGLEYLTKAFREVSTRREDYRLLIAGRPKNCERYWTSIKEDIREDVAAGRVLLRSEFIPDEETEVIFKAADVLVLPYRHIYQSGVLFLGYSFGLPVLVADVGSLKDEVLEGKTGFVFRPEDPTDLTKTIERYFESELFANLEVSRQAICNYATERYSWAVVAESTMRVYAALLEMPFPATLNLHVSSPSLGASAAASNNLP